MRGGAVELHVTYDEEAGGRLGPGFSVGAGHRQARLRDLRRAFPTPSWSRIMAACTSRSSIGRSAHAAQPSTAASMRSRRRRAAGVALWLARRASSADLRHVGHRIDAGDGRPHYGRDQHQRRARSRHASASTAASSRRRILPRSSGAARGTSRGPRRFMPAAKVEVRRILLAEPLTQTPARCEADRDALPAKASRVWAKTIAASGVPLYTDARHYATAGIPMVLYGAGPRTLRGSQRTPRRRAPAVVGLVQSDGSDRAHAGGIDGGLSRRERTAFAGA